jgi:hypothetical protein
VACQGEAMVATGAEKFKSQFPTHIEKFTPFLDIFSGDWFEEVLLI